VGLEAGSQLKSQGKWLGVGGPSVGLYVPLLEFNRSDFVNCEAPPLVPDIAIFIN